MLIGTTSVDVSETLSRQLKRRGLPHEVLNAKYHQREAEIVAGAGPARARSPSRPTWPAAAPTSNSIRMLDLTHRRGRACTSSAPSATSRGASTASCAAAPAARAIPGVSLFFLSLEDDLMRLFGSDRIARMMDKSGAEEGEVITGKLITMAIEGAQKRVELQNFQARKRLLEYDDVMNQQREVIYSTRLFALERGEELKAEAIKMIRAALDARCASYLGDDRASRGLRSRRPALGAADAVPGRRRTRSSMPAATPDARRAGRRGARRGRGGVRAQDRVPQGVRHAGSACPTSSCRCCRR